jgi:hypothetical protein
MTSSDFLIICDNRTVTQLPSFWTLSIILFLFEKQRFGDWILYPFWPLSLEILVSLKYFFFYVCSSILGREIYMFTNCVFIEHISPKHISLYFTKWKHQLQYNPDYLTPGYPKCYSTSHLIK